MEINIDSSQNIENLTLELNRLRTIEILYQESKRINLNYINKEYLVSIAYKSGEISASKAAELLEEDLVTFRERGIIQGPGLDTLLEFEHINKNLVELNNAQSYEILALKKDIDELKTNKELVKSWQSEKELSDRVSKLENFIYKLRRSLIDSLSLISFYTSKHKDSSNHINRSQSLLEEVGLILERD